MPKIAKTTVDQLSIVLDKWVNLAIADPNGENLPDNALLSVALQELIADVQAQISGETAASRTSSMTEWLSANPYYAAPQNLDDTGAMP